MRSSFPSPWANHPNCRESVCRRQTGEHRSVNSILSRRQSKCNEIWLSVGIEGPNGAAPRGRRTYRKGVSRKKKTHSRGSWNLMVVTVSRYKHSANQDYVARRYWVLSKHQVCLCYHARSTEILPRLSFPLCLRELMKGILILARSSKPDDPLCGQRKNIFLIKLGA